jgi:hypothetical protein
METPEPQLSDEQAAARIYTSPQAYVALSRARSLNGLFIRSSARNCIRANREALAFYGYE